MIEAAGSFLGSETKQKEATVEFVSRKDVFILLPTGYGKCVYYTTIPLIFDQLRGNIGSVVVVVSPLITQVQSFKSKRLEAAFFVLMLDSFADVIPMHLYLVKLTHFNIKFIRIIAFL